MTGWQEVLDGVFLWRDSCNVNAVAGPSGTLVVNAGTGAWIDRVSEPRAVRPSVEEVPP